MDEEDYEPDEDIEEEFDDELNEESSDPSNLTQHTILSYLVSNPDIWARVEPIIKSEYFEEQYKKVIEYVIIHSQTYKQVPSISIIWMKTGVRLDWQADATDERTTDWLLSEIETFCRHRATEIEILRAAQSIQQDNSRETLEQIFKNFKTITEISLEKDLGIEIHRDAATVLAMTDTQITKPTKYDHLDKVTGGGFPCPGMILFAGKSGRGKSVALANFAIQYCQQGDFVVYISLELPENRIFERVASAMTNTKIWEVRQNAAKIADHLGHRLQIGDGLLRVKKMKMAGTTTANVNAYLKELYIQEGIKPQVLVLDYLDLVYPRARIRDLGDIHIKDKFVTEETYSLCEEWQILILTASQMVKNSNDMDPYDDGAVGGGTPKISTVDYAIKLERQDQELIMRIIKGRYGGENTAIPFLWNINTLRISNDTDEKFFELNPRFHPDYQRNNAEKESSTLINTIRKDLRNIKTDDVLTDIMNTNQDRIKGKHNYGNPQT